MQIKKKFFFIVALIAFAAGVAFIPHHDSNDSSIVSYIANPASDNVSFYWKDNNGKILRNIENLKKYVESKNQKLVFAMNGGMYDKNNFPQGLYIEKQKTIIGLDTSSGKGNFYLKPNGVFYITTDNKAGICKTEDFGNNKKINYATQSGPMLLINGKLHPEFKKGSQNLNIRNGVGILPGGQIVFAMSKQEINFYDFANYFKNLGCKDALYLDGFVSRTYLPEKNWVQTDGNLGVMIAVTEQK